MSHLAETAVAVGDTDSAAVLHRLLLPWEALNAADVPEGMRGSTARYLGLLAVSLDRSDDAIRHHEAALAMNERMGARPWLALTQEDLARRLLGRGGAGDAERARELLDAAVTTYRELGMGPHAARALALARDTSASAR
jgi:hypothetical protein